VFVNSFDTVRPVEDGLFENGGLRGAVGDGICEASQVILVWETDDVLLLGSSTFGLSFACSEEVFVTGSTASFTFSTTPLTMLYIRFRPPGSVIDGLLGGIDPSEKLVRDVEAADAECISSRTAGSMEWRGIVLVAVLSMDERLVTGRSMLSSVSTKSFWLIQERQLVRRRRIQVQRGTYEPVEVLVLP